MVWLAFSFCSCSTCSIHLLHGYNMCHCSGQACGSNPVALLEIIQCQVRDQGLQHSHSPKSTRRTPLLLHKVQHAAAAAAKLAVAVQALRGRCMLEAQVGWRFLTPAVLRAAANGAHWTAPAPAAQPTTAAYLTASYQAGTHQTAQRRHRRLRQLCGKVQGLVRPVLRPPTAHRPDRHQMAAAATPMQGISLTMPAFLLCSAPAVPVSAVVQPCQQVPPPQQVACQRVPCQRELHQWAPPTMTELRCRQARLQRKLQKPRGGRS